MVLITNFIFIRQGWPRDGVSRAPVHCAAMRATPRPCRLFAACSLTREPAPPILPAPPPAPAPRVAEAPVRLGFVTRVTADADAQARLPMIVAVHGLGDRPEDFITLFAALPFAARVVAVRGITPYGDGFTWFPPGDADREPGAFLAATRAIAADLPALTRRFPTCGAPVITGFSQGGMLAFAVAAHAPGALRAAIPLAGRLPAAALPAAPPDRAAALGHRASRHERRPHRV
jgi:phospholipase/carboxylesterase